MVDVLLLANEGNFRYGEYLVYQKNEGPEHVNWSQCWVEADPEEAAE